MCSNYHSGNPSNVFKCAHQYRCVRPMHRPNPSPDIHRIASPYALCTKFQSRLAKPSRSSIQSREPGIPQASLRLWPLQIRLVSIEEGISLTEILLLLQRDDLLILKTANASLVNRLVCRLLTLRLATTTTMTRLLLSRSRSSRSKSHKTHFAVTAHRLLLLLFGKLLDLGLATPALFLGRGAPVFVIAVVLLASALLFGARRARATAVLAQGFDLALQGAEGGASAAFGVAGEPGEFGVVDLGGGVSVDEVEVWGREREREGGGRWLWMGLGGERREWKGGKG